MKKLAVVTFVIEDSDVPVTNAQWEHLFQYGYFQTGVHNSVDDSPFWDANEYKSDNPSFTPRTVNIVDLHDIE